MEITPFTIYLIGISNGAKMAFMFAGLLAMLLCGLFLTVMSVDGHIKYAKKFAVGFVISAFISLTGVFIPDTNTLIAMYTIPTIARNQQVQELPENLLTFINEWLRDHSGKK